MKKIIINKRKAAMEAFCLLISLMGVILFICGVTKTTPGLSNIFFEVISYVISIGFIIGPVFLALGIAAFLEVKNTNYSHKRTR